MDTKALKLASLFSFSPNSRGYCGLDSAGKAFVECIRKNDCATVPSELTKFITLNPYLQTISKIRSLSPFDYKVIEAYWIGNKQLDDFPIEGYEILLEEFEKQGVPLWLIKSLQSNVPKKFIPHHLFQVLHVGVGQASGSVPFNLDSINNCMIRYGKIIDVDKKFFRVSLTGLAVSEGKYKPNITIETIPIGTVLFCEPKKEDVVAVHWGQIVKIITPKEHVNLERWTKYVIKTVATI